MIYRNFSKRQIITATWWNRPRLKAKDGIICDGSIRSGKTLSMTIGFIMWSMSNFNGQSFAVCGVTIQALRRNVIVPMRTWIEGLFSITERVSENKLIIEYGNVKNTYYEFGGKDEASYKVVQGITLAGAYFDEVALMTQSFVQQVLARCSIDGSRFWFNCNPENPGHWFYQNWILKAREKNVLYLHFTMTDNASLGEGVRRRYENMYSGVFYRRYIQGLWVKAEGLVYPMFNRDVHIIHSMPQKSLRHMYYVSVDYGTVNPFAAGLYDLDPAAKTLTKIKELYYCGGSANRVDNEKYYEKLKKLIGNYRIEFIVIDPSAAAMIETIQKYGEYLCVKADNDVLSGIQDVTVYLNGGNLYFHEDCVNTFEEFETYSWDEDSPDDKVIKEKDHAMDELRYICRTVLRTEFKWDL